MKVNPSEMVSIEAKVSPIESKTQIVDFAKLGALAALDKKAENVVILDVAELTSYADFVVIASGRSERQTQTIARNIEAQLLESGKKLLSMEGFAKGQWILLDFGDMVVHVFSEDARYYYDLDGLWADAKRVGLSGNSTPVFAMNS